MFPAHTWKSYLYSSEDTGNLCIPNENLLSALLSAGSKVRIRGKETLKSHSQRVMFDAIDYDLFVDGKTIAKSAIDGIKGTFSEHIHAVKALGFRLHAKPVRVGKASHVRVRPIFSNWAVQGTFEIEDEDGSVLSLSALRDLFTAAGRYCGIGDWRPSSPMRPGQYGRFQSQIEKL